jgi:hypothetical protein
MKPVTSFWDSALFDPVTLTVGSLAATAVGGALSASSTLAGGSYARQAGQMQQQAADYQASQLDSNATQAIASSQRQMLDTQMKTRLAISSATARAAGSGVAADTGSPLADVGQLQKRGSYQALMDMWSGQSTATGLQNQAKGVRYTGQMEEISGEEQKEASKLAAMGTLASTAGSMFKTYGAFKYPTAVGRAGAGGF